MPVGAFQIFDETLEAMMKSSPGSMAMGGVVVTAILLGSLNAGDKVIGIPGLDDPNEAATVSSTNGEFSVQAPASGWFEITRG